MTAAQAAVRYLLDRVQTDPDVRSVVGDGSESFHLLCLAEAEQTGEAIEVVERRRRQDRQPAHRWRLPEVLELRKHVELLEEFLTERQINDADRDLDTWRDAERDRALGDR